MKQANYTDMLAQFGVSSAHPGGSILTKNILANENIRATTKILDVGCGTGQTSAYLAQKYKCSITALDTHPVMLDKAKKRFEEHNLTINLVKGEAELLPFKDYTFDYLLAESVILFTNLYQSLPEFFRVLTTEGRLISIEMVAEVELSPTEKEELKKTYGIQRVMVESEWKKHFHQAGFTNVSVEKNENDNVNHIAAEKHYPSDFIDPILFNIFEKHAELLEKYKDRVGYRIFRCIK